MTILFVLALAVLATAFITYPLFRQTPDLVDSAEDDEVSEQRPQRGATDSAAIENEVERQVRRLRQTKGLRCPKCGVVRQADARFCSRCGARIV